MGSHHDRTRSTLAVTVIVTLRHLAISLLRPVVRREYREIEISALNYKGLTRFDRQYADAKYLSTRLQLLQAQRPPPHAGATEP